LTAAEERWCEKGSLRLYTTQSANVLCYGMDTNECNCVISATVDLGLPRCDPQIDGRFDGRDGARGGTDGAGIRGLH
jgi:hypothetical protein